MTSSVLSTTSKQCFELTSSVLSTSSKQCFEQPAVSLLVCSLIFIEYKSFNVNEKNFLTKDRDKSKSVDRIKCKGRISI
ncbi:3-ketoacyl-ACP reductase [Streptococcus pneumoniae]|nr:3-ketoacyl-ACP reductase [Streptococcus pneumoniae]OKQ43665.1 3-ketoacyl-ACP reductase [Streptococcus pneumoniae]